MHEDIKRGFIASFVGMGMVLLSGATFEVAATLGGIGFFAGAIAGYAMDRLGGAVGRVPREAVRD